MPLLSMEDSTFGLNKGKHNSTQATRIQDLRNLNFKKLVKKKLANLVMAILRSYACFYKSTEIQQGPPKNIHPACPSWQLTPNLLQQLLSSSQVPH